MLTYDSSLKEFRHDCSVLRTKKLVCRQKQLISKGRLIYNWSRWQTTTIGWTQTFFQDSYHFPYSKRQRDFFQNVFHFAVEVVDRWINLKQDINQVNKSDVSLKLHEFASLIQLLFAVNMTRDESKLHLLTMITVWK